MNSRALAISFVILVVSSSSGLSVEIKSVKGSVSRIDPKAKTIKIGDVVIQAPETEFGVVPVGLGGSYSLMDSGHPAEVKVGDEVEINYVVTKEGKYLLRSMANYSRSIPVPAQPDNEFLLIESSLKGDTATVQKLLEKGINPNTTDEAAISPLMFAALSGNIDIGKALVEKGANVNARDDDGRTPLFFAATKGHLRVVEFLVEHKADVDPKDYRGATLLSKSTRHETFTEKAQAIFDSTEVATKDKVAVTPLMSAKNNGHDEVVKFLLSRGAKDVDISNLVITTPLAIVPKKRVVADVGGILNDYLIYVINVLPQPDARPEARQTLKRTAEPIAQQHKVPLTPAMEKPYVEFGENCSGVPDQETRILAPRFYKEWVDLMDIATIKERGDFPKILLKGFQVIIVKDGDKYRVTFPDGAWAKVDGKIYTYIATTGKWVEKKNENAVGK